MSDTPIKHLAAAAVEHSDPAQWGDNKGVKGSSSNGGWGNWTWDSIHYSSACALLNELRIVLLEIMARKILCEPWPVLEYDEMTLTLRRKL